MEWWEITGIKRKTTLLIAKAEKKVAGQHREIDANALHNQAKVLESFKSEKISEDCFHSNEGYGYHDRGRDKLENLFSRIFNGEDSIVRPHFVSGTHTLFTCLRGLLRPGERLLSLSGMPYDTLRRAIIGPEETDQGSYSGKNISSLREWNISFAQVETAKVLQLENYKDLITLLKAPTKVVFIQRSRGYNPFRQALTVSEIARLAAIVRRYNRDAIILVDNCYGEFVEREEPLAGGGADLIAGSLIKNPGGGLAPAGGYITGRKKYISLISEAFSAPGLGKDLGAFIQNKRLYFQGLFMAPQLVAESLKGAVTIAAALEEAGYSVSPRYDEKRGDLVQTVRLKNKEELELFCSAVQQASPVNAHFQPVAGATPGYADPLYMAAGTFVQGSSSEFSADAPLREPYTLYIQGGLSYNHVILGLACLLDVIIN
ncbi:MAG: methionine gamma-lyase family protein [Bacillota bacterium]